ncbi:PAS domain S-box protein [Fulvivirga sp. 29W222]|uniref:PAS domain S-box protein n=1 Tax=Fulvivirga marina TaxID=2494733 RepID=A0A937FXX9_9BACT|nr:PAS domain S-box protein [Fulvivirga marina]MBL6447043.1 PAS domain S-box protein [Fulvivirga marina]
MKKFKLLGRKVLVLIIAIVLSTCISAASLHILNNTLVSTVFLAISLLATLWLVNEIANKLINLKEFSAQIDSGVIPVQKVSESFSQITFHIQSMHFKMQEVIDFVKSLGNETFQFKHLDVNGPIGSTLVALSENQIKINEEEKRRSWQNEGLAKFSELLRTDDKDLKELSFIILSNMVKYVGVNQGAFFVQYEEENERFFELSACYAYDRKKFIENRIKEGQGLIGQVMLEKEIIFLTDIPDDYINITSGLGEATPNNIIIVPLLVNDICYGAIELASFEILPPYKVEFLKEVAEVVASTVSSAKINQHTKNLLAKSQQMSEELRSQEEEMRHHMEKLQSTQEELQRGKIEIDGLFSAINSSQGLVEFDTKGNIITANESINNIIGLSTDELRNRSSLLLPNHIENLWASVEGGENYECELEIKSKSGKVVWLNANYSGVKDASGNLSKILVLLLNITARKEKEKEFERLSLVADNTNNSVIITNAEGLVEYVNPGFTRLTKYTLDDMFGKKPGDVLQGKNTDKDTLARIRKKLESEESLYEEILNYDKEGNSYWVSMAINPVKNENGEVDKYISVQADITETKISALDYKNKLEAINRSNAVIEFDINGNIIEVNDNFLKIVNYKREELIGKHHEILIPKEDINSPEYKQLWADLKSGKFINREFRRINRDKEEIWMRGVYNPLLDIEGKTVKIIKYATDVTKEKELHIQTENQRKELSSHLETLNKTIAILEFDKDAKIINANKVYLDISGYDLSDLLGKGYEVLLTSEESKKPQNEMMWSNLMEGHFFTGQFKQQSKEGKNLWLLGTFNPVMSTNGEIESFKMFAQFNTLEKEREINNTQLLGAFKNTVPVIELTPEGKCAKANQIFHNDFGISKLELRNRPISDFFKTDFSVAHMNNIVKKNERDQVVEDIISHVSQEGNIRIFRAVFHPIKNSGNDITRILMILIDKEMIVKIAAK